MEARPIRKRKGGTRARPRARQRIVRVATFGAKSSGYVDLAVATYAFNTTGTIALLATVPSGTSVVTRVGKRIRWKSIQMRGSATNITTALWNDCALLLVYDRRPGPALPAITDILVTASSRSFNNDANSGRFQIVRRWDFTLNGDTAAAGTMTANTTKNLDEFVDLRMRKCTFKAAGTGAIDDIDEGALYVVSVGHQAASTAAANAGLGFRVRFVDIAG